MGDIVSVERWSKRNKSIPKMICCILVVFVVMNQYMLIDPGNTGRPDHEGIEDVEAALDPEISNIEPVYVLSSNERVVNNYTQLKDALANNNGVTKVYLGSDITMEIGSINIHSSKTEVQISGLNPTDPGQTIPYTLTEYDSNILTYTISLASNGTLKKLLVSDLKIIGKNWYSTFYIPDDSSNTVLTIAYERIVYNGPQMIYHRYGTSHLIDCDVTIAGTNATNANQEFGEVGNLIFEGENTIRTATTTSNGVFYYTYITNSAVGIFEIKDQSSLTLIADQYTSGTDRGIFYTGGYTAAYGLNVTVGTGSELNIKTSASLVGYSIYLQANFRSFTIEQGGAYNLQTTTANSPVMLMTGAVTIADGASFIINSTGSGNSSGLILEQTGGNITVGQETVFQLVAAGTYSRIIQLNSGYKLECDDPASVLLYNSGGRVVQSASNTCGLSIDAQQVNYWTAAGNGGLENPPNFHWKNTSGNITISANVGSAGVTSNVSHNYAETEYKPPDSTTFSMASARALSFGRLELVVTTPTVRSAGITGVTAPEATVRVSFRQQGKNYILPDTTADSEGVFHINTGVPLEANTVITIKSNHQYLNAATEVTVSEQGDLEFTVPERMEFFNTEITMDGNLAKRLDPDWHIVVSDTRGAGGEWSVYARIIQPLTPSDNTKPVLTDALVFVNHSITPLTSQGLLIHHHISASDNETSKIHWATDRGILIQLPINTAYSGMTYTGIIEWTLVDAP